MIMSGNEAWNRNVFKRWWKVDRDGADITLSGKLFQLVGPATGKARPPMVDSFTDGTSRRLVRAEGRERWPRRSATQTSWLTYDGAVPWVALYMSTAVLNRTLSWARSQWRLCHMGSDSVTCHPAEVTFAPLLQPKAIVLDLATPKGCKAKLT